MRSYVTFCLIASFGAIALAVSSGAAFSKPDKGGKGPTGNTPPKFEVTVTEHPSDGTGYVSGDDLWAPGLDCLGETPDAKSSEVVTVVFFHHQRCADLIPSDGPALIDDLVIRTPRDEFGDIEAIYITGQDDIGRDGISYISDVIPLAAPVTPPRGGTWTIHVHKADANLYNCNSHNIRKGTGCGPEPSGTFSIDDITYTCIANCEEAATIESTIRYWPGFEPQ